MWTYVAFFMVLLVLELVYFKLADKCNIIDKPNERSSHKRIVLRGGGIIFSIALWIWSIWSGFEYPWLVAGVTLAAGISFWDDVKSLPDSLRLVVQFAAMFLVLQEIGLFKLIIDNGQWTIDWYWQILVIFAALIAAVGATNIYNFMDGINGITGGYSLAMLIPLMLLNQKYAFVDESMLIVIGLSVLVFCIFNFRTKAKCFAGDVGSIGIALILVFAVGRLMLVTDDITWVVLFLIYGVDGCLTICHRIMLHENLGQAHRKHAYQLMANELKMPHVVVSTIYMAMQLAVSLVAIYLVPDTVVAHWIYLVVTAAVFAIAYILFKMKYYHLHEEYLRSISFQKDTEPKENSTNTKPLPSNEEA